MSADHRPPWWDAANDRAMVICRISDRKQVDGVSLDAQNHQQRGYVERVGLRVAAVESFQESAKKSQLRVQFHAAIARARREGIRHLVFYVYDRITRNFTDAEILEEMIRDGQVVLHLASSGNVLHKGSDDSEFFLFDINIAHAKQDNRGRRRKTIDGMEERCRQGWYPSRPPHFYKQEPLLDENGRPKRRGSTVKGPTEEGRRLVRREMQLRLRGFSLARIREKCLEEGLVPAWLVAKYHHSTVEKHLKQDFYAAISQPHDGFCSQFVWRNKWYEGKHEPIYSADEWAGLQESFKERPKFRKRKHEGLFAQGALTLACDNADCGCKITYEEKVGPNGTVYRYYHCTNAKRVHRGQTNIREDEILNQLASAVDAICVPDVYAGEILRALNETHATGVAAKMKQMDTLRAEILEFEAKEDRLFDRLDAGGIDSATYDRQLARTRAERGDRQEKLRTIELTANDNAYLLTAEDLLEIAKSAKRLWEKRSPEEKRDLLARLVSKTVLDGRTVRYDLRKPFAILARMRGVDGWRPQRESNPR